MKNVRLSLGKKGKTRRVECSRDTLFSYIVQFMRSSESMAPSKPNNAPEAPTEMVVLTNKEDNKLPPIPDITYTSPMRAAED